MLYLKKNWLWTPSTEIFHQVLLKLLVLKMSKIWCIWLLLMLSRQCADGHSFDPCWENSAFFFRVVCVTAWLNSIFLLFYLLPTFLEQFLNETSLCGLQCHVAKLRTFGFCLLHVFLKKIEGKQFLQLLFTILFQ